MTNVSSTPKKVWLRRRLFQIGVQVLQGEGWAVEKIQGIGKASVRRITKGTAKRVVAIRTTQDQYISFPRNAQDKAWVTLSDVDAVVAVSVDDVSSPKVALVHMVEGEEMRDRFDRAYQARLAAGHSIPVGRGVWVPLYLPDEPIPPAHVGGGAGLVNPPLARVPIELPAPRAPGRYGPGSDRLGNLPISRASQHPPALREVGRRGSLDTTRDFIDGHNLEGSDELGDAESLTIAEAKRRLALSLGVDSANIKITVEA
jgi:hypothetical protein